MELLQEQIQFRKTGTYSIQSAAVAEQTVYSQKERMRAYVVGLLLSYLFWPNHYEMFQFYLDYLRDLQAVRCLEVGAGHGLFAAEMLHRFPAAMVDVVDISSTSIQVAGEILDELHPIGRRGSVSQSAIESLRSSSSTRKWLEPGYPKSAVRVCTCRSDHLPVRGPSFSGPDRLGSLTARDETAHADK